jgi:polysaccharide biosynthesis protein PelE
MRNTQYVFGEKPFLTLEKPEDFELQSVRSVLEILSSKDENLRRTAIIGLRSADPKKSLPLLRKAIQDSDEQVRLLAQTQFNRILAKLETAVKRMEAGLPESTHRASDLVVLAEHYHELVYLAVSSQETESIYLERATQLLTEALDLSPDLTAARFLLLRCQVKTPDIASAKASLQTLLASGFPENSLLPWMAEICFVERDWNTFLKTLRQMDASPSCDSRLADRLSFWLRPANRTEVAA